MSSFDQLIKHIQARKFVPVYYLHGEEGYFIDKLVALFQDSVLQAGEIAFNREIFFGADANSAKILNACKSFPVFADRRLVIVKEAQKLNKKDVETLIPYLQQPIRSTLLVLAYKGKNMGLPKEGEKAVSSKFTLNLAKCPTCEHLEYACTCDHGHDHKEDEEHKQVQRDKHAKQAHLQEQEQRHVFVNQRVHLKAN